MTRLCILLGIATPLPAAHCDARPVLTATDRGRCWSDPRRIPSPRAVRR